MKSQNYSELVHHVMQQQFGRRHRLEAARAAEQALSPDERETFLAELIDKLDPAAFACPSQSSSPAGISSTRRRPTIRAIIRTVLARDDALGCADVCHAVIAVEPSLKKASVASELTQMRQAGLVVRKGAGPRGSLYALAPQPANDQSIPV